VSGTSPKPCAQRTWVAALIDESQRADERLRAERHLEHCAPCREYLRQRRRGQFPDIPEYTVLESVGAGAFGVVYKAIHHTKQRVEALKVLKTRTPLNNSYFENEVRAVARLRHPNISTLFDARLAGAPAYYSMEFVEGQDLDTFLRTRQAPLGPRIEVMKKVAAAIGYAHAQGVVHRDIKPQNILLDAQGEPHIVDFGISRRLGLAQDETPRREGAVGTFGYISPEQLAGRPVDERADIYALGALLYHVVTGEPARLANNRERLAQTLREGGAPRAGDLAAIIAHCVEHEPSRRYASCAALIADLDHFQKSLPIAAREARPLGYAAMRVGAYVLRTHPQAVRGAVIVASACVLALTFSAFKARWSTAGLAGGQTALIAFQPSTLEALRSGRLAPQLDGLEPDDRFSWRLLHGALMKRLAVAQPRVVVWDYYFPKARPMFDPAFVDGVRALQAPVIVAAAELDINGEPAITPEIRAAAAGYGFIGAAHPESLPHEYLVTLALARGFESPIPGLAVSAFAAWRFPDAQPRLRVEGDQLQIRYLRRTHAPGEPRYHSETDSLPIRLIGEAPGPPLQAGDRPIFGAVPLASPGFWSGRVVPYERVMDASDDELRSWFQDKAVLIGELISEDQYPSAAGSPFGCQIQALTLQSLLDRSLATRYTRFGITWRALLWSLLAAGAVYATAAYWGVWRKQVLFVAAAFALAAGLSLAVGAAAWSTRPWLIEVAFALAGLLVAGGLTALVATVLERPLRDAFGNWSDSPKTVSTTLVAETD